MTKSAVIIDAVRTPMGKSKGGMFRNIRAEELSAHAIRGILERNPKFDRSSIDDILWGCVQQTLEQGFNIARFAQLKANIPHHVPAQTINRLCGSSMQSIHSAAANIMSGQGDAYICGGVEHMGHVAMSHGIDIDPQSTREFAKAAMNMGLTAELLATQLKISREEQDEFALRSHINATAATKAGKFREEIVPIEGHDENGVLRRFDYDEVIRFDASRESLSSLRPVFNPKNGTVTAGNASAVSDGASAALVMSEEKAKEFGLKPQAKIIGMATVGLEPSIMGYGPVPAIQKLLKRAHMTTDQIDLWELNEAFAAQSLSVLQGLGIRNRLENDINVNGGAIALGHPLGCSGTRIVGTLLHELRRRQKRFGIASMCIGMGQGIATLIERIE